MAAYNFSRQASVVATANCHQIQWPACKNWLEIAVLEVCTWTITFSLLVPPFLYPNSRNEVRNFSTHFLWFTMITNEEVMLEMLRKQQKLQIACFTQRWTRCNMFLSYKYTSMNGYVFQMQCSCLYFSWVVSVCMASSFSDHIDK